MSPSTRRIGSILPFVLCLLAGCAPNSGTVGPTFDASDGGFQSRNGGPITLAVRTPTGAVTSGDGTPTVDRDGRPTVPVESVSTTATGPGGYALATETEARWVATNTVMRNVYLRRGADGQWVINSSTGTDLRIKAAKIELDPASGILKGEDLTFETVASEPFRASNESLTALKDWYLAQTEAQRKVFIAQVEAQASAVKESMPTLANALTQIVGFLAKF